MGIRTGEQYINAVKSRQPDVWWEERKVENVMKKERNLKWLMKR